MKTHESVFLSLVRSALWDTHCKVPDDFKDWGLIMRLANSQSMDGAAAKGMLDNPDVLSRLKPESKPKLTNMLMTNLVMHSMANSAVQTVVSCLRTAGIECVLLKGQGLASYYKHPEVRDCGDIDLYVGEENYHRSYEVLKTVATKIDDLSTLDNAGKHYHAIYSDISIEVHKYSDVMSSAALDRIFQRYATEGLTNNLVGVPFGDVIVNTPADNFNAFFIFIHLWNHFISTGVGFRQICDWAVFLHARGVNVDKEYLGKILDDLHLTEPWKTFGCIAVDVLGLHEEEMPFYDTTHRKKAHKVIGRVLTEGDMGRETEFIRVANKGYFYDKLFSLKFYFKRFAGLVMIFPCHAFRQLFSSVIRGLKRVVFPVISAIFVV